MFAISNLQQAGTNPMGWVWYVIVGLVLLALVVWALFRRVKNMEVESSSSRSAVSRDVSRDGKRADDLTKIEGIGPKVAKVLNESGITTFDALSRSKSTDIQGALNAAGLQMMNPEGWIEQADLAAKGDWAKLEKLQGELKGGRRR